MCWSHTQKKKNQKLFNPFVANHFLFPTSQTKDSNSITCLNPYSTLDISSADAAWAVGRAIGGYGLVIVLIFGNDVFFIVFEDFSAETVLSVAITRSLHWHCGTSHRRSISVRVRPTQFSTRTPSVMFCKLKVVNVLGVHTFPLASVNVSWVSGATVQALMFKGAQRLVICVWRASVLPVREGRWSRSWSRYAVGRVRPVKLDMSLPHCWQVMSELFQQQPPLNWAPMRQSKQQKACSKQTRQTQLRLRKLLKQRILGH